MNDSTPVMPAEQHRIPVRRLVRTAVLAALSLLLMQVELPLFPAYPFLRYDPSNVVVVVGAFLFGTVTGTWIIILRSVLNQLISGNPLGTMMSCLASLSFVVPASIIYHRKRSLRGGLLGMALGTLCLIVSMIIANWFVVRWFGFLPEERVAGYCLYVVPAFNLVKAGIDTAACLLVYKRAGRILRRFVD